MWYWIERLVDSQWHPIRIGRFTESASYAKADAAWGAVLIGRDAGRYRLCFGQYVGAPYEIVKEIAKR